MIYRHRDGSWWVQLTVPRNGQVFAWSGYRTEADAQAVEERLRGALAREASDAAPLLGERARQLPLGVGE